MFCQLSQCKSLQYDKMNAPNYNIIRVCKMYKGYLRRYHTLQGDNSLKSVECFDHMNPTKAVLRWYHLICSFNFFIFLAVCLNISTVINIKILTNFNQQTQFTSHITAFVYSRVQTCLNGSSNIGMELERCHICV
jgi:hypothetical protein